MTGTAYLNGRFVPAGEVTLPLNDAGHLWGAVVADRLRTFNGRLFRLDDHLRRFRQSCDLARIPQPVLDDRLREASEKLVELNRGPHELTLVWLATPGPVAPVVRVSPGPTPCPTLVAYTTPLEAARYRRIIRDGIRLQSVVTADSIDPRIKHRSRLAWWIAVQRAHDLDPDADALFLEPASGHVLETPTANLVAVLEGVVTSPPAGTVLDGISLNVVKELCRAANIPFAHRAMTLSDLALASEVLLTNTTYCVAGVSRIDEFRVSFPGPILRRLLDAWTELVGTDVRALPGS
jgi:branched-chain amino acid aminotransferase